MNILLCALLWQFWDVKIVVAYKENKKYSWRKVCWKNVQAQVLLALGCENSYKTSDIYQKGDTMEEGVGWMSI